MTKQNSFRIRNYENELATVFPIGMGEFFTVAWDNDAPDTTIYAKWQVDAAFEKGKWEKLEEASEEALPRTFKFKCKGWPYEYDYTRGKGYRYLHNGVYGDYNYHSASRAIECIKSGEWIVLPSEPEVNLPEGLSCETLEAFKETMYNLGAALKQPESILQQIKDFTSGTGHDVFISEGGYKVYRNGEDSPYVCQTDEQVVAVMGALIVLDSADGE